MTKNLSILLKNLEEVIRRVYFAEIYTEKPEHLSDYDIFMIAEAIRFYLGIKSKKRKK